MEKTKTGTDPKSQQQTIPQILAERAVALAKKGLKSKGVKSVILVLLSVIIYHAASAGHALTAALYIFANDGKVSGRMSGDVKMRNGRQRAFTVPSLVRNIYTSIVRARFQTLSSGYRSLSSEDLLTWVNAVGFSYIDRFAVPHALKGKGLYVRINSNLINVGAAPLSVAPIATGSPAEIIESLNIGIGATSFVINAEDATVGAGYAIIVFATTSLNNGILRPSNSAFRQFTVLATGSTISANLWAEYIAKFGVPVLGGRIFVRFIQINLLTGEASAISQSMATVVA